MSTRIVQRRHHTHLLRSSAVLLLGAGLAACESAGGAPDDAATHPGDDLSAIDKPFDASMGAIDAAVYHDAAADLATPPGPADMASVPAGLRLVGYYETWSEPWVGDGSKARLANVASYVGVINLSFAQPDAHYAGGLSLAGTGLQFPYDGATLKQALVALRQKSPGAKVLIAVGGATYTNWAHLDTAGLAALVRDFGFDGVDIDYEPVNPDCRVNAGKVSCASDAEFTAVVRALRAALPRPLLLSVAAWSIGAFGEGNWAAATPMGAYTGLCINTLKAAGGDLDLVNVMSYDASNAYSPEQGLAAYQAYYKGPVMMGVEVPPEAWGGHVTSLDEIDRIARKVTDTGGGGMMLWSLQKMVGGPASPQNPSATMIAQRICADLNLGNCQAPIF